ncbi:MAG: uroporphyrinogen-III synthase [Bacteroidetes bacterium]|nr:uroporphyrinogen-III synthase [Bacteroidota bacterium]
MSTLLITRALTASQQQLARELGLLWEVQPVLQYTPKYTPEILAALVVRTPADAWAFTSAHAARAVAGVYRLLPRHFSPPVCYAMGAVTAEPLVKLGWPCHLPKVPNATQLARLIAEGGHNQPVHWCGRDRRKELTAVLLQLGLAPREHILYEMQPQPIATIPPQIRGIAVLSPRSGEQLPAELSPEIALYAIGPTTREALAARYPRHLLICSPIPTMEALLHTIAQNPPVPCPFPPLLP